MQETQLSSWNQWRQRLAIFASLLLFVGLIASKFLITVGMIGLMLSGFISPNPVADFQKFWKNKAFVWTTGLFWIILITGLYSSNLGSLMERLRIALPYLLLPIAFGMMPAFSKRQYQLLLYTFVWMMFISAIGVMVNYMLNFEELQHAIQVSKAIPTPQNDHIRFSLLICLALYAGAWLWQDAFYWRWNIELAILLFVLIVLWLVLHVLSVRSGLLAFYIGGFMAIARMIILRRKYLLGVSLMALLFSIPIVAYYTIPSFHTKVRLTYYNWEQFQAGNIGEYSDTQRLLSYQVALRVGAKAPWIGVGMGDYRDEQRKIYEQDYPSQKVMNPHNQLLSFYVGAGILGLLAFGFCFFFPLFYQKGYRNFWLLLFYSLIFSSFLTENTIMIAIGVAIHSFFLLLHLKVSYENSEK